MSMYKCKFNFIYRGTFSIWNTTDTWIQSRHSIILGISMLSLRMIDRVQTSEKMRNRVSCNEKKEYFNKNRSRFELNSPLDGSKKDEDSWCLDWREWKNITKKTLYVGIEGRRWQLKVTKF